MEGFPLFNLIPTLKEKIITKFEAISYFRLQQTCRGVGEFIRRSKKISIYLEGKYFLYYCLDGTFKLYDCSDYHKIEIFCGIRLEQLCPFDKYTVNFNGICDVLKGNRITCHKLLMQSDPGLTVEQFNAFLDILKPVKVSFEAHGPKKFLALFKSKKLKNVNAKLQCNDVLPAATKLLPTCQKLKITVRLQEPLPFAVIRRLLQIFLSNPFPQLQEFSVYINWKERHLHSKEEIAKHLDGFTLSFDPKTRYHRSAWVELPDAPHGYFCNVILRRRSASQIVLITGSGSGIGRLMAKEFAILGARVVLWDVNEKGNQETLAQVNALGAEGHAYTVDLSKKEEIYSTAKKVKTAVGDVDILINNAGVVTGRKLFECPDELMELTLAVNCNALLFTGKTFIPSMLERNHGHIVTIASMAGKTGCAGLVDYCASKHGAVGFHESLTAEVNSLKKTGVHTTVVCPVYINTGMFDGVETKSPNIFPILDPEFVVERIMDAVLTNQRFLALPRSAYLGIFTASFLPSSVVELISEYFGINETMEHFKGRAKLRAH